ncbi:MAG: hypothetical protein JWP91_2665 [Fibrobacteres bacterium]|nr:hypothetical protein [Fibrobacterota bacterium]
MKKETELGMNRTGMAMAPKEGKRQKENEWKAPPIALGDSGEIVRLRAAYDAESGPIGTVSPPATIKGVAKTALQMGKGHNATALIDKIGERLAFERAGTRLYELLIGKFRAGESETGDADLSALIRFHDEEREHFLLLWKCLEQLGADPTVQTPSADHTGVKGMGLLQTMSDPRSTFYQCLDAILIAELADNEAWKLLSEVADGMGLSDMAASFRDAQAQEQIHLDTIRTWWAALVKQEAGIEEEVHA